PGQDRSLVEAEVVAGPPAAPGNQAPGLERHVVLEARIDRIEEAVARIQVLAVALVQLLGGGDHDLGREGDRADRRGRRDRAVVELVRQARTARTVVAEFALVALELLGGALRAVAGGQAPDVRAIGG